MALKPLRSGCLGDVLDDFLQFSGELGRDGLVLYVLANCHSSFEGFQAGEAGDTVFSMFLDFGTVDMIQLSIDVFRQLFEHLKAMLVVVIIAAHF
jgi:hypothetical protein